eukprot:1148143-Pelagomonas_calceolata.AAC.4
MLRILLARCVRGGASLQPFSSQPAALLSSLTTNAHLSSFWEPASSQPISSPRAQTQTKQNLALCKANFSSSSGQLDEAQERQAVSASTCLRGHYVGRVP